MREDMAFPTSAEGDSPGDVAVVKEPAATKTVEEGSPESMTAPENTLANIPATDTSLELRAAGESAPDKSAEMDNAPESAGAGNSKSEVISDDHGVPSTSRNLQAPVSPAQPTSPVTVPAPSGPLLTR